MRMSIIGWKIVYVLAILAGSCLTAGCGGPKDESKGLAPAKDLGNTIGSLVEVTTPESIPVEGYGLVAGLSGTGSVECPAQIKAYLIRYIQTQLPQSSVDAEKLISSRDTAVVHIEGAMPAIAWKNQPFDVRITALPATQTTSLENGSLYTAELKVKGTFGITTRVVANAEGPIFIDKTAVGKADKRLAYVLNGGKILEDGRLSLELRRPDFRTASRIRNRLNERFGIGMAQAVSPARIELTSPAKYALKWKRLSCHDFVDNQGPESGVTDGVACRSIDYDVKW
jgi:flagellar P-ring protein precursor FlgI